MAVAVALEQLLAQTLAALARLLVITAAVAAVEQALLVQAQMLRATAAMAHKVSLSLLIQQKPMST